MFRITFFLLLITFAFSGQKVTGKIPSPASDQSHNPVIGIDTLQKIQLLYRGIIWTNKYRRYNGDQFFISSVFQPGTVSANGYTFRKLRLKYDIHSDEIITPLNNEEILQLNKEMIDSFSITSNNKTYRFINIRNDSTSIVNGYCNLLYKGGSLLLVKYIKRISTEITTQSDGSFNESFRIFILTGNTVIPVRKTRDFFRIAGTHREEINRFISEKKLKLSKNEPATFIPVLRYYDSINK